MSECGCKLSSDGKRVVWCHEAERLLTDNRLVTDDGFIAHIVAAVRRLDAAAQPAPPSDEEIEAAFDELIAPGGRGGFADQGNYNSFSCGVRCREQRLPAPAAVDLSQVQKEVMNSHLCDDCKINVRAAFRDIEAKLHPTPPEPNPFLVWCLEHGVPPEAQEWAHRAWKAAKEETS
jgi:hypothetical protein